MATKQRSFFDQPQRGHRRYPNNGQWHSDRFRHNPHHPSPDVALSKAPIPASSLSKAKLKAFTYSSPHAEEMVSIRAPFPESDKENIQPNFAIEKSKQPSTRGLTEASHVSHQLKTPKATKQRERPETPGVSLEDLLDDNHEHESSPPRSTPRDQVGWEHNQIQLSQLGPITPSLQRGKKRPRSESPPSSSRKDISGQPEANRYQDLITKTPIRTPRYDPGPELWKRYARNELNTPSRPPATANPELLHSSPQEPFASGSRSYRRVTSDLTHTIRKRRRLNPGSFSRSSQGSQGLGRSDVEVAASRARLPFLLEKLREVTGSTFQDAIDNNLPSTQIPQSSLTPAENVNPDPVPIASQQLADLVMTEKASVPQQRDIESFPASRAMSQISNHIASRSRKSSIVPDQLSLDQNETVNNHLGSDSTHKNQVTHAGNNATGSPSRQEGNEFSDFDIGDDDLLSTCLQIESCGEKTQTVRVSDQLYSANEKRTGTGPTGVAYPGQKDLSFDIESGPKSPKIEQVTGGEDFGFDEFDADDLVEMELEMSKYDQTPGSGSAKLESRKRLARAGEIEHNDDEITTETHDETRLIAAYGAEGNPVDLIEDEFADEELDDAFAELVDEHIQRRHEKNSSPPYNKRKTIQRYLVKSVHSGQYQNEKGFRRQEQVLSVEDERTKMLKAVVLRDSWNDSPATPGSYVHVLADFDQHGQCVIDNEKGILILHPDHLISATVVADSFKCIRRAVLQDRVKSTSEANQAQVYGHILHEIFQEALKANNWDNVWLDGLVRDVAIKYLESLFEINIGFDTAVSHLKEKMQNLKTWADTYVSTAPNPNAVINDRGGGKPGGVQMSINKLLDVEEHIWSPMYGLKGNVDATVQVVMRDAQTERTLTVPFELKTGSNTAMESHRAQTALYTLLMSDRYDIEIAYGILYYLESSEMSRIPGIRLELVHMIKQRNELATYVRNRLELPPMLRRERDCKRCYAQTSCFIYHKLAEDGTNETSGMGDEFTKKTQHLLPQHHDFFKKWDGLLTKEESDLMKFRRELWTMTSTERQKVGRCFAKVIIEPGSGGEIPGAQKINRYKYSFVKHESSPFFSFSESQINVGEPIVVSDEEGHYALANGYVTSIRKDRVTVAVDRRLHNARTRNRDFDVKDNQSFAGIMEVGKIGSQSKGTESSSDVVYRIDKDEFSNGMATVRNNIIRIMEKDLFGAQPLRRLIVDLVEPTFMQHPKQPNVSLSQASLNVDQHAAIAKVMTAKDYALVLGMPGTGKTTTIAHIIRALTAQGKSVLLTSYTHTAVDNILLKIRDDKIGVLRIGAIAKVHPGVAEFADLAAIPKESIEELKRSYNSQVVATTCLGINHPIFNQRVFDYCIVDEASQITLPVCLGPIRMAKTFILVGDHFQLPPLVQNKEAIEGGLDVSLFKYLSDAHPNSVVTLRHQYRMCEDIMSLSNELIYDGRLKCGSEAVASRRISMPSFSNLAAHHHTTSTITSTQKTFCPGPSPGICWLHDAIKPSSTVIFLNTDPLGDIAKEQAAGSRIVNEVEVKLTAQLVRALISAGVNAQEVGVITLYRSQLALMRQELKTRSTAASASSAKASIAAEVEMHTADKYQGRDKEAIVLSLVRSNEANNVGDLLKDWRRVNVALTRARTKLIIVGSWSTMQRGNELLNHFCNFVSSRGWKYDLKEGACRDHYFDELGTQVSTHHLGGTSGHPSREPAKVFENSNKTSSFASDMKKGSPPSKVRSQQQREPERRGRLDPRKLLGRRPVLRNIVNESLSIAECELVGDNDLNL